MQVRGRSAADAPPARAYGKGMRIGVLGAFEFWRGAGEVADHRPDDANCARGSHPRSGSCWPASSATSGARSVSTRSPRRCGKADPRPRPPSRCRCTSCGSGRSSNPAARPRRAVSSASGSGLLPDADGDRRRRGRACRALPRGRALLEQGAVAEARAELWWRWPWAAGSRTRTGRTRPGQRPSAAACPSSPSPPACSSPTPTSASAGRTRPWQRSSCSSAVTRTGRRCGPGSPARCTSPAGQATRCPRSPGPGPCSSRTSASIPARAGRAGAPGPHARPGPARPAPAQRLGPGAARPAGGACPWKGLASYESRDAALFHGREQLVAALTARLVDHDLVVLAGASGSGKSSVVRAGLVPALAAGALPDSADWMVRLVLPREHAGDALASLPDGAPCLLVVDQLEEVWSAGSASTAAAFLDDVVELLDKGRVTRVVAVVRGDHLHRLAEHPRFAARAGSGVVLATPLTAEELRRVVEQPAAGVGLAVDPELVTTVVETSPVPPAHCRSCRQLWSRPGSGGAGTTSSSAATSPPAAPPAQSRVLRRTRGDSSTTRPRTARPCCCGWRGRATAAAPYVGGCRWTNWAWTARPARRAGRSWRLSCVGDCSPWTTAGSRSPTRRCSPRGRGWPSGWPRTPTAAGCAGT